MTEYDNRKSTYNQYNIKKTVTIPEEKVRAAIALCEKRLEQKGILINNPICYEDPEQTVNISIDDVGVKKQKESRQRDGSSVAILYRWS